MLAENTLGEIPFRRKRRNAFHLESANDEILTLFLQQDPQEETENSGAFSKFAFKKK